jgi:thiol-disulfide isomerase/thioredoxin
VLLAWVALWSSSCQTTPATSKAPNASSRLAKDLIGTWVLVDNEMPYAVRLKFFTGRYWTITEADPVTGLTTFHIGGTYTLDGDRYTETIEYANPTTSNLINQTFQFTIKTEGDTLTQTGIGNPWTETWKRAVPERTSGAPKSITVQVEDGTGAPLSNVTVVCVDGSTNAWLEGTVIKGGSRKFQTDNQGRFVFAIQYTNLFFMVSTDAGFGLGQSRFLFNDPLLVVEPWGRIEGTRVNRGRPVTNQQLSLEMDWLCLNNEISTRDRIGVFDKTTTDSGGRFVFPHVPPIGLRLYEARRSKENWLFPLGHLAVQPGQVKQLQVTTNGRDVTGRLEAADGLPPNLDLKSSRLHLTQLKPASHQHAFIPLTPKEFDTPQKRTAWWEARYESEGSQVAASPRDKEGTALTVQSNGWFTSDIQIAPGRYRATGSLMKDGKRLGMVDQYVDVPEGDKNTDSPYDLGKIILKPAPALQAGDVAPDVKTETLDNKPLKLSDFRGRYVLLDFWATWCGPCRAETPNLKNVYDSFGKDRRFVMISLSLDEDRKEPKGYVEANKVGWTQAFLGDWDQDKVTKAFDIDSIPSIWLIGPDGKIVAKGLRGGKIRDAVAAALGSK